VLRTADIKSLIPETLAYAARVLAQLGERGDATIRLREAEGLVEQQVERGNLGYVATVYNSLGQACLQLGSIENAHRFAERAIEAAAVRPVHAPQSLLLLADIASHPDRFDPENGETCYRKAMAAAETQGQRPVLAHCHFGLGRLYSQLGERREAGKHFTIATTMYRDMGMTYWLREAEAQKLP